MVTIRKPSGETVKTSKNLRGILDYARCSSVMEISIDHSVMLDRHGKFAVIFTFEDGCCALTYWSDWRVLLDWLLARRSWPFDFVFRFAGTASDIAKKARDERGLSLQALINRGVEFAGNSIWGRVEGL
jgi:hypothetical protein